MQGPLVGESGNSNPESYEKERLNLTIMFTSQKLHCIIIKNV